jgi:hypothetical protein
MNFEIRWSNPSEDKPAILENVRLTKELIEELEAQYGDKIITIKPKH